MTFCLSSGGHNVGVVNPPGPGVKRSFQLATRKVADPYVAPESGSRVRWAEQAGAERRADAVMDHSCRRLLNRKR